MSLSLGYNRILEYLVHRSCDMATEREDKIWQKHFHDVRRFCCVIHITGAVFATNYLQGATSSNILGPIPKEPMGVGTGVSPGRVVWVWNPNATEKIYQGTGGSSRTITRMSLIRCSR